MQEFILIVRLPLLIEVHIVLGNTSLGQFLVQVIDVDLGLVPADLLVLGHVCSRYLIHLLESLVVGVLFLFQLLSLFLFCLAVVLLVGGLRVGILELVVLVLPLHLA